MSTTYTAFDHKEWDSAKLKEYSEFSDGIEFVGQREDGPDQLAGAWYYGDDETRTIYYGTFGNYNSPGASTYTFADVFDDEDEYRKCLKKWEETPEYLEEDNETEDE